MKTHFTDEGVAVEMTSGDILEANDSREMREFSNGRKSEDSDDDDEDESGFDSDEMKGSEGLNFAPEAFFGLHPNHRGHGISKLAYQRDNRAAAMLS